MKKSTLFITTIFTVALALGACKKKAEPELPDAPIDSISLSMTNFGYLDTTPDTFVKELIINYTVA